MWKFIVAVFALLLSSTDAKALETEYVGSAPIPALVAHSYGAYTSHFAMGPGVQTLFKFRKVGEISKPAILQVHRITDGGGSHIEISEVIKGCQVTFDQFLYLLPLQGPQEDTLLKKDGLVNLRVASYLPDHEGIVRAVTATWMWSSVVKRYEWHVDAESLLSSWGWGHGVQVVYC